MNSRQIEIFYRVMKAGTLTDAAAQLGITQPAVTASLKQIEASLGFNLFHRAGGRLHPTAEAKILYNEAERIHGSLDVFKKLADRLKKDLTTHLRITTPPVFSQELIPQAIAQFTKETKSCLIDVTSQHHDDILNDISSNVGHNNLGITFGLDDRAGIGSVQIGRSEIKALVPAAWKLAQKASLSVEDIVGVPVIGTFPGEPLGNAVEAVLCDAAGSINHVARVHNHSVAANLASKGVGLAVVDAITAATAVQYNNVNSFKILDLEGAPSLPVTAIYSYEHPLNKNAKRFIEIFRACFREQ